jgi:hypothetical protein
MQLRFLHTIADVSGEHTTHTVLPLPLEIFRP